MNIRENYWLDVGYQNSKRNSCNQPKNSEQKRGIERLSMSEMMSESLRTWK